MSEEDPLAVRRILEEERCIAVSQQAAPDRTITANAVPRRLGIWEPHNENGELMVRAA
jgi:hypothetical protein